MKYNEKINHHEKLTVSAINKLNWEKRKKIIEFAYAKIPFYTDYYKAHNFSSEQLKSESDWELVPIIMDL